eukprot:comp21935_c0_seq1/m.49972 comp21935_c0_seq1/g.49972  ORF comp21935_c0_seq1/g.49972 comp21935_c0_seq1/m.49972 type:complete len:387 (-) comp21935_c0_seq1:260-1420(-)
MRREPVHRAPVHAGDRRSVADENHLQLDAISRRIGASQVAVVHIACRVLGRRNEPRAVGRPFQRPHLGIRVVRLQRINLVHRKPHAGPTPLLPRCPAPGRRVHHGAHNIVRTCAVIIIAEALDPQEIHGARHCADRKCVGRASPAPLNAEHRGLKLARKMHLARARMPQIQRAVQGAECDHIEQQTGLVVVAHGPHRVVLWGADNMMLHHPGARAVRCCMQIVDDEIAAEIPDGRMLAAAIEIDPAARQGVDFDHALVRRLDLACARWNCDMLERALVCQPQMRVVRGKRNQPHHPRDLRGNRARLRWDKLPRGRINGQQQHTALGCGDCNCRPVGAPGQGARVSGLGPHLECRDQPDRKNSGRIARNRKQLHVAVHACERHKRAR